MKSLWKIIDESDVSVNWKSKLYVASSTILSGLLGFVLWLVIGRLFFESMWSMLCFIGYPAVFLGFFNSIIVLYNNDFS